MHPHIDTKYYLVPSDIINIIISFIEPKDVLQFCKSSKDCYKYIDYYYSLLDIDYCEINKIDQRYYKYIKKLSHVTECSQLNIFNNLTHLTFSSDFDQNVDKLPNTLTHLTFGENFNQNVDKLPKNLTHLTFGWNFNQNVDKLPNTLTHYYLFYRT